MGTTQGYFIQSAVKDYGSEGSNPTFFSLTLYVIAEPVHKSGIVSPNVRPKPRLI